MRRGASVIGVDFAPNMVAVARFQCPGAAFQEADAGEPSVWRHAIRRGGLLAGHSALPESGDRPCRSLPRSPAWRPLCLHLLEAAGREPVHGADFLGSIQAHGTLEVGLPAGPPLFRFGEAAECDRVLHQAGFIETVVTECPLAWPLASPEEFLREIPKSAGRLGPCSHCRPRSSGTRSSRLCFMASRLYQTQEGGVRIPSAVLVASGQKP